MRATPWLALAGIAAMGFAWQGRPADEWTVIIAGHSAGYLAPCGCSSPMVGGVKRKANALKQLAVPNRTLVLEAGGMVTGTSRQDAIKAETMAESLRVMNADAIGVAASDTRLNNWASVMALAQGRFVAGQVRPGADDAWKQLVRKGPFAVTSISADGEELVERLGGEKSEVPTANVVLWDGDQSSARAFVRAHPAVRLVIYQSEGDAADKPLIVGKTWLVSPGDHSRSVIQLRYRAGVWSGYRAISLDPRYADDRSVEQLYRMYLKRVDQAGLLDRWPRQDSDPFVGSETCIRCHEEAGKVWSASAHHHALKTLETKGHDRDPDCVVCHVTGLDFKSGFRSRALTPQLTDVGCESCHGPGKAHSDQPKTVKFVNIGENACLPCHTNDNSPGFNFLTYWSKVRHGLGITGGKNSPAK